MNNEELKKERQDLKAKEDLFVSNMKSVLEIEKEHVRKETAKEILQLWYDECMARLRPEEAEQVANIAKEYGVEMRQ